MVLPTMGNPRGAPSLVWERAQRQTGGTADGGRDFADVPDESGGGEQADEVVEDVHFPPVKAGACGGGIVMVVVVPSFAEGQQRDEGVVGRKVARGITARAQAMAEVVDGGAGVDDEHAAEAEADGEH